MARELPERCKSSLRMQQTAEAPTVEVVTPEQVGSREGNVDHFAGQPTPTRLLRFPAVRERTGLSRSTIWRLERRGEFPRHRRISANAVAWVEKEVADWIRGRVGDASG